MPQSATKIIREEPSVSFHYLTRFSKEGGGKRNYHKFSQDQFNAFCAKIAALPALDLDDGLTRERVRSRQIAPLGATDRIDSRTLFGSFEGSYSGHAYRNTHAGKIPAVSISLRSFYYLAYLSNSGRIYIGAQYLGHFGGYEALQRTFKDLLGDPEQIESRAVRVGGSFYAKAEPKEVKVTFARSPEKIIGAPSITDRGIFAFKKQAKDDNFETIIRDKLLLNAGKTASEVRKAVASLTSGSDVITIDEDSVRDCTILADFKGRRRTIYMLESGVTASKIPLSVDLTPDGHPVFEQCKAEMRDLLSSQVIAKLENG